MSIAGIFQFLVTMWWISEVGLLLFTHTRKSQGSLGDRGSLLLLWPTIGLFIWLGTSFGGKHPHTLFSGAPWLISLALALLIVGLVVRWVAILSLGRAFSVNVAIQTNQQVNQSGPYRFVRHPSYSGLLLALLAIGIATRNWMALLIVVVPPVLALLYCIHVEEGALTTAFGSEYSAYSARTKRLIPGVY